jgi:hypothetical protein
MKPRNFLKNQNPKNPNKENFGFLPSKFLEIKPFNMLSSSNSSPLCFYSSISSKNDEALNIQKLTYMRNNK